MAFLTPSARLVFGGRLYDGAEIWACSLGVHKWGGDGALVEPSVVAPVVAQWFTGSDASISHFATLEYVKLNQIDGQGQYLDQSNTHQHLFQTPFPVGAVTQPNATLQAWPQLSVCVSLTTAARRGPASMGRFFPPLPIVASDTRGHIARVSTESVALAAGNLIAGLNRVLGTSWQISVLSEKGAARHVTGVRVGDIMDTQRRRRNAYPEEYVARVVETAQLDPGAAVPVGGGLQGQV